MSNFELIFDLAGLVLIVVFYIVLAMTVLAKR